MFGRLRYLLTLSRPRFWLYLAGPIAVAVPFGVSATDGLFTPVTLPLFAYFLLPANVFLYGINDVFDADPTPQTPWPEVQPLPMRVPIPTRMPPPNSRQGWTSVVQRVTPATS